MGGKSSARCRIQHISTVGKLATFCCCCALEAVWKVPIHFSGKWPLSRVCDSHSCAQDGGLGSDKLRDRVECSWHFGGGKMTTAVPFLSPTPKNYLMRGSGCLSERWIAEHEASNWRLFRATFESNEFRLVMGQCIPRYTWVSLELPALQFPQK